MPSQQHDYAQPADAIAMLKADHQRVKDLFAHYEAAENVKAKRTLAEHVFVELEMHAQLEEHFFYPAVHDATEEGPERANESLTAHETMQSLIQELRGIVEDAEAFDATFHELIHTVEHHVAEEEATLFPLVEASAQDLTAMKDEMQELKHALLAS
jgi:hemerythrin superfamily protein